LRQQRNDDREFNRTDSKQKDGIDWVELAERQHKAMMEDMVQTMSHRIRELSAEVAQSKGGE